MSIFCIFITVPPVFGLFDLENTTKSFSLSKQNLDWFLPHSPWGIVFTHGVRMDGWAAGNSLSGLYLRNRKV